MDIAEKFYHWIWGENNLRPDRQEYLINLEIGVSIRFENDLAMFANFDQFMHMIADIQFIYGTRPDEAEVQRILTDAWNFLALEERKLENDLTDEDEDFFNEEDDDYDHPFRED